MKRLAELRKEKGLSQLELAEQTEVSVDSISSYEIGRRTPTILNLKKMATYFNVSIDYLVGYSDERQ
ncbi:Transcriptional regulator [Fructobacillus fructosus]|uniref:Contains XRE-family HTH domain (HipB) n=1 Tax=Fructobacillus fructosus TaxID=1631 RepID=A0ABN9YLH6_9LACO|nr:Transcriptional regulator [Fructobacillus fructosus]